MKTSTKILILVLITQMLTCCAWMLMHLAHMWLDTGHGINPWIALPIAGMCSLIPYMIHSWWFESDRPTEFDLETIEMPINRKPIDSGSTDFPKDVF